MTITVTNTVQRPDGTPWKFGQCRIGLIGSGFVGGGVQIVDVAKPSTDATGLATVALVPNATGEYYVWTNPTSGNAPGQQYYFQVPATGGPYTLQALLSTTVIPAGIVAAAASALLAYVAKPTVAPTDGQVLAWSASLSQYVAVAPTGASEIASASNVTGTGTTATASSGLGTAVVVPGTSISVPDSGGRRVTLHYGGIGLQTVTGLGDCFLTIQETTSGTTSLGFAVVKLPNVASGTDPADASIGLFAQYPLGVVSGATRTFRLIVSLWSPSGSSPSVTLLNTSPQQPTFLRAVAG